MVLIKAGTTFRIENNDTPDDGILVSLDHDIEVEDLLWDEELQTAYIYTPLLSIGTITGYKAMGYRMPTVESLNAMLRRYEYLPNYQVTPFEHEGAIMYVRQGRYYDANSAIMIGDRLVPMDNRYGEVNGIIENEDVAALIREEELDSKDAYRDVMDDLIKISDLGYVPFPHRTTLQVSDNIMYMMTTDHLFVLHYMTVLMPNRAMIETLYEIKAEANAIVDSGHMEDHYHRLMNVCPPYMAWFVSPSGWYNYGYESSYEWILHADTINIRYEPLLTYVLLANHNVYTLFPSGGPMRSLAYSNMLETPYIDTQVDDTLTYDLDPAIKEALATINMGGLKVVLAGGFVVTRGDYDFFILGGDKDVAARFASLLNMENARVSRNVITSGRYQLILAENIHSIHDVLYSFDLSHAMVAHDGTKFHMTPEFITFTTASLSLMVMPITRVSRVKKIIDYGFLVVHSHSNHIVDHDHNDEEDTDELPIDEAMDMVEPLYIGPLKTMYGTDGPPEVIYGDGVVFSNLIDKHGNNHGIAPSKEDTMYYVYEYFAMEILHSSHLADPRFFVESDSESESDDDLGERMRRLILEHDMYMWDEEV